MKIQKRGLAETKEFLGEETESFQHWCKSRGIDTREFPDPWPIIPMVLAALLTALFLLVSIKWICLGHTNIPKLTQVAKKKEN